MNIKTFNLLLKRLQSLKGTEQAKRFNMDMFGGAVTKIDLPHDKSILGMPVCKTQACLAGETLLATGSAVIRARGGLKITKKPPDGVDGDDYWFPGAAADELGLTPDQASRLFYLKSMARKIPTAL